MAPRVIPSTPDTVADADSVITLADDDLVGMAPDDRTPSSAPRSARLRRWTVRDREDAPWFCPAAFGM